MNAVLIRGDWVGKVIDGRFSLLKWLGGSGSSGTFLTEFEGQKAAIKLLPASSQGEEQLATWMATAKLSHRHLVRLLRSGRGEVDGAPVLYIVTELAEEALAQIIPERPLTDAEAREMVGPVLEALTYLHGNGFVHGHVKPSNILVVENEVKLSSDGLIAAGKAAPQQLGSDGHYAPEMAGGPMAPSADIWSLGMTLVEALTQHVPAWKPATKTAPLIPALPEPFAAIARECLHVDPKRRCSLSDIRDMLDGGRRKASTLDFPAAVHTPVGIAETETRKKMPVVPLIVGAVLLIAILIGLTMHSRKTQTAPIQTEATQQAAPAEPDTKSAAVQAPESSTPDATGTPNGEVLTRVIPEPSRGASNTIHGKVGVAVRVHVDESGGVTNAEFVTHGPSAYFARLAMNSARNWKFKPPTENGRPKGSTWLLHYAFRRDGTDVTPVEAKP